MQNLLIQRGLPSLDLTANAIRFDSPDWGTRQGLIRDIEALLLATPTLSGELEGGRKFHLGRRWQRPSLFPSKKNAPKHMEAVSLRVETRGELANALMLERDTNVGGYLAQSPRITLPGGESAFPDFVVIDQDGYIHFQEFKPNKQYLTAAFLLKSLALQDLLTRWGFGYQLIDENDLPSGDMLVNLFLLYHSFSQIPTQRICNALTELVESTRFPLRYDDFCQRLIRHHFTVEDAGYLLFTDVVKCDLSSPNLLDSDMEVWT